jgi:hypothetical protein
VRFEAQPVIADDGIFRQADFNRARAREEIEKDQILEPMSSCLRSDPRVYGTNAQEHD